MGAYQAQLAGLLEQLGLIFQLAPLVTHLRHEVAHRLQNHLLFLVDFLGDEDVFGPCIADDEFTSLEHFLVLIDGLGCHGADF